jgi:hypothetical protein
MDDRRFDSIARSLAEGHSRREVLKGLLGLGGVAAAGIAIASGDVEAARRGFSGPTIPTPPPPPPTPVPLPPTPTATGPACVPNCDGVTCGDDGCGGSCGSCSGSTQCIAGDCFRTCNPASPSCDIACHCDSTNAVCVFDTPVGSNCSVNGCPAGSFCNEDDVCVARCASGA